MSRPPRGARGPGYKGSRTGLAVFGLLVMLFGVACALMVP